MILSELVERHLATHQAPYDRKATYRISSARQCIRARALEAMNHPPDVAHSPRILSAFRLGHDIHAIVQAAIVEAGGQVEVPVSLPDVDLGGSADALWQPNGAPEVVEVKSMASYGFRLATGALERPGERPGVKLEHAVQAGLYARGLGAERIRVLYWDRDSGSMAEWEFHATEALFTPPGGTAHTLGEWVDHELRVFCDLAEIAAKDIIPPPMIPGWGKVSSPPGPGSKDQPWQCRSCLYQPTCKRLGPGMPKVGELA